MTTTADMIDYAEISVEAGDTDKGLELFLQARDEAFKVGDVVTYIRCCQSAAVVYDNLKMYEDAVASLDLGISFASLDVVVAAGLLVNKGVCLLKLKEWNRARESFLLASSTLRKTPPRMRTQEMHELIDMAENNVWGVDDILKLIGMGLEVKINTEGEG